MANGPKGKGNDLNNINIFMYKKKNLICIENENDL